MDVALEHHHPYLEAAALVAEPDCIKMSRQYWPSSDHPGDSL